MKPSEITVDEFTTPSPQSVPVTEKLPGVWQLMQDRGIRHVLVEGPEGKIVGILSQRDLTTFSQSADFEKIEAQDVMSRDLVTVPAQTKLYEVALKMSQEKIGSTVVENVEGGGLGIFTATDALNALVEILRGDL